MQGAAYGGTQNMTVLVLLIACCITQEIIFIPKINLFFMPFREHKAVMDRKEVHSQKMPGSVYPKLASTPIEIRMCCWVQHEIGHREVKSFN